MQERSAVARLLALEGDVRIDFIASEALAGNPLGDPATRPVVVYTPPGYDPGGSPRYPAIYVLHGYTGDVNALLSTRPWETNVLQWADRLVRERRMPPALVVLVDGFTRLGGSQYVDSIHNGDYATYTVRDVVGHVDRTYRTIASEGGRAVARQVVGRFRGDASGDGASGHVRGVRVAQRRLVLPLRAFPGVCRPSTARSRRTASTCRRTSRRSSENTSAASPNTRRWRCWRTPPRTRRRGARAFDHRLALRPEHGRAARRRLRALAGVRPGRARAVPAGRARAAAPALRRLRAPRRIQPRHRRSRRARSGFATSVSRCGTRNSTTIIATSDIGTKFRCRRSPPHWIEDEEEDRRLPGSDRRVLRRGRARSAKRGDPRSGSAFV